MLLEVAARFLQPRYLEGPRYTWAATLEQRDGVLADMARLCVNLCMGPYLIKKQEEKVPFAQHTPL